MTSEFEVLCENGFKYTYILKFKQVQRFHVK